MLTLNDDNFIEFAVMYYRNPRCLSADEFFDDLDRIVYVKRLLNRYSRTGVIQEKLLVNHLISIYNVFDIAAANAMMFKRTDEKTHGALKTFLLFLNYLRPEERPDIKIDKYIHKKLNHL